MKTYKLTVKRNGKQLVRTGLDELNARIIPAELKIAFPKQFISGEMTVEVEQEK